MGSVCCQNSQGELAAVTNPCTQRWRLGSNPLCRESDCTLYLCAHKSGSVYLWQKQAQKSGSITYTVGTWVHFCNSTPASAQHSASRHCGSGPWMNAMNAGLRLHCFTAASCWWVALWVLLPVRAGEKQSPTGAACRQSTVKACNPDPYCTCEITAYCMS